MLRISKCSRLSARGRTNNTVDVLLGRQRHGANYSCACALDRFDDFPCRRIDDLVVIGTSDGCGFSVPPSVGLFLDVFLYRSFCSFVIAEGTRYIHHVRHPERTESGLCRKVLTRRVPTPRTRACRPYSEQARPVILRTGSYVGLSDTDRHFDNVVNSLKYSGGFSQCQRSLSG